MTATPHFSERGGHDLTPSEHYREAERLLRFFEIADPEEAMSVLIKAQIHATLATLAVGR